MIETMQATLIANTTAFSQTKDRVEAMEQKQQQLPQSRVESVLPSLAPVAVGEPGSAPVQAQRRPPSAAAVEAMSSISAAAASVSEAAAQGLAAARASQHAPMQQAAIHAAQPRPSIPQLNSSPPLSNARASNLGLSGGINPQALQDMLNNLSNDEEVSDNHTYNNNAHAGSSSDITWSSLLEPTQPGSSSRVAETVLAALVESGRSTKTFKTAEDFVAALNSQRRKTNAEGTPQMRTAVDNYYTFMFEMLAAHGFQCAQNYHWALAKKISDQTHSLLHDGHFNAQVYTQVMLAHTMSQTAKAASASRSAVSNSKSSKKYTSSKSASTTTPGPFPKGSCSKHPDSTTHTTDKCRQR
jgi:hypothetical protein